MVLPLTTTVLPSTDGPPHGLSLSGVRQTTLPVLASRQYRARSPTFSLSRNAEATRTLSPARATGASTCHLSCPCCQTRAGSARGSWSSLGGTANVGSAFFSFSYFACRSFQAASVAFCSPASSTTLPPSFALSASTHSTPAAPPPMYARPPAIVGEPS